VGQQLQPVRRLWLLAVARRDHHVPARRGIQRPVELYIEGPGVTGFNPAGGLTSSPPALTAIPSAQGQPAALIGFARGTDNAGYYHRFIANTPGWHSMGGNLTTGPATFTQIVATIPNTYTYALGTDNQIYENVGAWAAPTPGLSGWHLAS
jgi:hypothetical protein